MFLIRFRKHNLLFWLCLPSLTYRFLPLSLKRSCDRPRMKVQRTWLLTHTLRIISYISNELSFPWSLSSIASCLNLGFLLQKETQAMYTNLLRKALVQSQTVRIQLVARLAGYPDISTVRPNVDSSRSARKFTFGKYRSVSHYLHFTYWLNSELLHLSFSENLRHVFFFRYFANGRSGSCSRKKG